MTARAIAYVVRAFYVLTGAWAFLFRNAFYSAVAAFTPCNLHLLHDVGVFSITDD